MKQDIYAVVTDKRSIPFNQAGTGTIACHGTAIVGTGTLFMTELKAGSWIVDLPNWEARRVVRVDSDTSAFLESRFSGDPAGTPQIIPWYLAKAVEISLDTASDTILLNNKNFKGVLTIGKASRDRSSHRDLVQPIIVDASGGKQVQVNILY